MRDWTEDVAIARAVIRRMVDEGPRENPILRLATFMAEQGEHITINAEALKFQVASDFGGAHTALDALDELDASHRLPPARIVNRHGEILVPDSSLGHG